MPEGRPGRADYGEKFLPYRRILGRLLRHDPKAFGIPLDAAILDVGCGFGDDIRRLHALGYRSVTGVEPDPFCVARRGDLDIRPGAIEKTGLPGGSFDAVLVNNVFHHTGDYAAALAELKRVLKESGLLCFIEPRNTFPRRLMDLLTFHTPLPSICPPVKSRHEVMIEEVRSGLYPRWLRSHGKFFALLRSQFALIWLRRTPFFYFCKASRR